MGASKKWLKAIAQIKLNSSSKTAKSEGKLQKQSTRWNPWRSCRVIDQESIHGGEDDDHVERDGIVADVHSSQIEREEWAAIRIQTAFRAFLARRALCALRGLVRLQAAINGHNSRTNSLRSLRSIQTFIRTQAQIRAHRSLKAKGGPVLPKRILSHPENARPTDGEDGWCDTIGSVEEIQARMQQKQEASIKRERALAYAFSNQWRANSRLNLESLFDYELDNSTWSWIWLDRWINSQTALGKFCNTKVKSDGERGEVAAQKVIELQKSTSAESESANSRSTSPVGDDCKLSRSRSHGAANGFNTEESIGQNKLNDGKKPAQKSNGVRVPKHPNFRSWSQINDRPVKNRKNVSVEDDEQKLPGKQAIEKGQGLDGTVDGLK